MKYILKTGNSCIKVAGHGRNKIKLDGYNPSEIQGTFAYDVMEAQVQLWPLMVPHEYSLSALLTIENLTKEKTPTTSETGTQNRRRYQAWIDAYNFLALAVVLLVTPKI